MRNVFYLLALMLVACDSDVGWSVAFDSGPIIIDDSQPFEVGYAYRLSTPLAADPMTLFTAGDDGTIGVAVDFGQTLTGNIIFEARGNLISRIDGFSISDSSSLSIDSDTGNVPFLGTFDIEVSDTLVFMTELPFSGTFLVVTPQETVAIEVFPAGMTSSVTISLDGAAPIGMGWDELEDLLDDESAPPWQRRAALASEILEFTYDQLFAIARVFGFINDQLLTVNPATIPCDAFTGTPPPGVLQEGMSMLTWLGPGNTPGSGDNFDWAFTNCWYDDTASAYDLLFDGNVVLSGYGGRIDDGHELMGHGFDELLYDNLVIRRTIENSGSQFALVGSDTIEVTGSFSLAFDNHQN